MATIALGDSRHGADRRACRRCGDAKCAARIRAAAGGAGAAGVRAVAGFAGIATCALAAALAGAGSRRDAVFDGHETAVTIVAVHLPGPLAGGSLNDGSRVIPTILWWPYASDAPSPRPLP